VRDGTPSSPPAPGGEQLLRLPAPTRTSAIRSLSVTAASGAARSGARGAGPAGERRARWSWNLPRERADRYAEKPAVAAPALEKGPRRWECRPPQAISRSLRAGWSRGSVKGALAFAGALSSTNRRPPPGPPDGGGNRYAQNDRSLAQFAPSAKVVDRRALIASSYFWLVYSSRYEDPAPLLPRLRPPAEDEPHGGGPPAALNRSAATSSGTTRSLWWPPGELDGEVILTQNKGGPESWFGLVTGFWSAARPHAGAPPVLMMSSRYAAVVKLYRRLRTSPQRTRSSLRVPLCAPPSRASPWARSCGVQAVPPPICGPSFATGHRCATGWPRGRPNLRSTSSWCSVQALSTAWSCACLPISAGSAFPRGCRRHDCTGSA